MGILEKTCLVKEIDFCSSTIKEIAEGEIANLEEGASLRIKVRNFRELYQIAKLMLEYIEDNPGFSDYLYEHIINERELFYEFRRQ